MNANYLFTEEEFKGMIKKTLEKFIFIIVITILLLYSVSRTFLNSNLIFGDDSSITNVYARHFAETGKFYYNNPEKPIDGFTSTLDVMIKSLIYKFFIHDIIKASIAATLMYHLMLLLSLTFFIFRLAVSNNGFNNIFNYLVIGLGLFVIFFNEIIVASSMSYLETSLFILLGFWAVYMLPIKQEKTIKHILFFLILILLSLSRPEGIVMSVVLITAYIILARSYFKSNKTTIYNVIILSALYFILLVIYLVLRIKTFGYWAPNPYFAKTSSNRINEIIDGLDYIKTVIMYFSNFLRFILLLIMPFLAIFSKWKDITERSRYIIFSLISLIMVLVTIYSGGDCYYNSSRMLALPFVLSLAGYFYLIKNTNWKIRIVIISLLIIAALGDFIYDPITNIPSITKLFSKDNEIIDRYNSEYIGVKKLSEKLPNIKVAQSDFQKFKLYAADNIEVIDLHGLNNQEIAHQNWQEHVLWGKSSYQNGIDANAEIWIFGYIVISDETWTNRSLSDIMNNEELFDKFVGKGDPLYSNQAEKMKNNYILASIPIYYFNVRKYLNFLIRKDVSAKVRSDDFILLSNE
jgi:hypothetical protein